MRNARHIGRVGALAVALGVGIALANTPGVAFAEGTDSGTSPSPGSSSHSSSSATSGSTPSDTPSTSLSTSTNDPANRHRRRWIGPTR
jgi:hypothetical protein